MNRFVRFYRCRLKPRFKAEILFWRPLLTLFAPDLLALALPDVLLDRWFPAADRVYMYIYFNQRWSLERKPGLSCEFVFANITSFESNQRKTYARYYDHSVLFILCNQIISEIKLIELERTEWNGGQFLHFVDLQSFCETKLYLQSTISPINLWIPCRTHFMFRNEIFSDTIFTP